MIDITVTFISLVFLSLFFSFVARSRYLFIFFLFSSISLNCLLKWRIPRAAKLFSSDYDKVWFSRWD